MTPQSLQLSRVVHVVQIKAVISSLFCTPFSSGSFPLFLLALLYSLLELLCGMGDPVKALVDRHRSRSHARETVVLPATVADHSKEKREPSSSLHGTCVGPVLSLLHPHLKLAILCCPSCSIFQIALLFLFSRVCTCHESSSLMYSIHVGPCYRGGSNLTTNPQVLIHGYAVNIADTL